MATDAHFRLRLPAELHTQITELAEKSGRSINGEVVALIQTALGVESTESLQSQINDQLDLIEGLREAIARLEGRIEGLEATFPAMSRDRN